MKEWADDSDEAQESMEIESREVRPKLGQKWSAEEDKELANCVRLHGERNWGDILETSCLLQERYKTTTGMPDGRRRRRTIVRRLYLLTHILLPCFYLKIRKHAVVSTITGVRYARIQILTVPNTTQMNNKILSQSVTSQWTLTLPKTIILPPTMSGSIYQE